MIAGLLAGLAVGSLALLPFAHPNLLSRFSQFFTNPLEASVFLAALAGSHVAFSLFPSLFLFFPSEHNAFAGAFRQQGSAAVRASVKAFAFAAVFSLAFSPIAFEFFPKIMESVKPYVGVLLAVAVVVFFSSEKSLASLSAGVFVFVLAGCLGFVSLALPIVREPLLPLLSGLFGFPAVISLFLRLAPGKEIVATRIEANPAYFVAGSLLGAFSGFLPAMTPAVLSGFAFLFFSADASAFLALNASIIAAKNFFDFANAFAFGKARSGASAAVLELVRETGVDAGIAAPAVLLAVAASTLASAAALLFLYPRLHEFFSALKIKRLSVFLALGVLAVIFAESGVAGIAVALAATLIGLLPRLLGLRHACATGALIAPALAYYGGFSEFLASLLRQ